MRSRTPLRSAAVLFGLWTALVMVWPSACAAAGVTRADSIATALHSAANGTLTGLRWSRFPHLRDELDAIYSASGWRPVWTTNDRPTAAARTAVDMLLRARESALDPDDYDAELLDRRLRALAATPTPPARELAWFDAALTVDFSRHLTALRVGRVVPKNLAVGINVQPQRLDLAREIRTALASGRVAELVRDAEPRFIQYRNLKAAYARYRALADRPHVAPISAPKALRPGEHFDAAGALRRRLALEGDVPASTPVPADSELYDAALAGAVAQFQGRHGLAPDSVLGPSTLTAINVPFARRERQIELAMERIRWLPELRSTPFIVVNVPSFQLYAFDSLGTTGTPSLTMNVVVGRDQVGRRTPLFERDMKYIVFRPYWVITRSILKQETLPAIRRNSGYMSKQDLEIYSGGGDTGPAVAATPANLDRVARGELGIRQRPGPKNSLGLAKFIFPNDHNVYMHGTPATELFSRARRDFSHGCIRLEDPAKLGVWVLRDPRAWPPAAVQRAMEGPKPRQVNLAQPLRVIIYYTTAVARTDGSVAFFDDVYRHDARLEQELAKGYPFAP